MSTRARIILVCVVAALGIGITIWIQRDAPAQRAYVTATALRGTIEATVTATGTLNAVITVQVGTYVSGRIREIYADFNSPVKRGQVVAKIDPDPFDVKVRHAEAGLMTARARVQRAVADRDFKKIDLGRHQSLIRDRVVSQDSLDNKLNAYRQAEAQVAVEEASVAQAEAALAEARINLRYTDIVSPVDGVVLSRNVDVGQTVAASFQTPTLFLIAEDLTQMRVNANISESDIGRVRVGQSARFSVDAYPDREFNGAVSQRRDAPIIEQNVVTYDVMIDVSNQDLALKPGMTATVSITTDAREDALVVPLRALRFRPDETDRESVDEDSDSTDPEPDRKPAVWVVQPNRKLRRAVVETGIRNDESLEITAGAVAVGDELALAYERE